MAKSNNNGFDWVSFIREVQAIAQTGLAYTKDEYDKERYHQLLTLVSGTCAEFTGAEQHTISKTLFNEVGYATPKLCVRAFVLKDDKVLLVKERQEGLWSLPGGWCDVNLSPSECVIKELKEETGYDARIVRFLALWDKLKHEHPPHWPHTYLLFFHCEIMGGKKQCTHEISDVKYFPLDKLPQLSTPRITEAQINNLFSLVEKDALPEID